MLDKFADIVKPENLEKLRRLNAIFVPNRSFSVYAGYENIEQNFSVPVFGNRFVLRTEERNTPQNQHYLLKQAQIKTPKIFDSPADIDRLVIIKVCEKDRAIERAFFFAESAGDYEKKSRALIEKGTIDENTLKTAIIEEYVIGAKFNANYFFSPLTGELDLLGFDRRVQTDIEGLLDLPAAEQLALNVSAQNIEIGHTGATMRESQLEKIFDAGEKFVAACGLEDPPGMIGLFARQGAIGKDLEFCVFDVSPRVPGCPCVEPTSPYMKYKYGIEVGPGRRVAMEIKKAAKEGKLQQILT